MALGQAASLTALTALSQIEGTSNQAAVPHEELTLRYRHLLDNILASLLKDSETALADAAQSASVLERLLECVQHCVQALPFLFLPQEADGQDAKKQDALRFSESLVGRLLALLSIPGLAPLCGQFCQVLESLLRLYKRHKVALLRQFLDSLLELFVDVCQFCASDSGNAAVMSQFGVTLSSVPGPPVSSEVRAEAEPAGMQEEAQEAERTVLRIAFVDGGYAFRLSLVKLMGRLASDLATFGSGRRFGRDRLARWTCRQMQLGDATLTEESLKTLQALLEQYWPLTNNTEAQVILCLAQLLQHASWDEASMPPSLLEALSSLVGAVPEFPGVSPYVTEEILLALSKAMCGMRHQDGLLAATARWFGSLSKNWNSHPLEGVLAELRNNLRSLLDWTDPNVVPSETYIGIVLVTLRTALYVDNEEMDVSGKFDCAAAHLRSSFVAEHLERLLQNRENSLRSLQKVALCLEILQQAAVRIASSSTIEAEGSEEPDLSAEISSTALSFLLNYAPSISALVLQGLDESPDDGVLTEHLRNLVLLMRCREPSSTESLVQFVPVVVTPWASRFGGRPNTEFLDSGRRIKSGGNDPVLCASLATLAFFCPDDLLTEPLLQLALSEGSPQVKKAALRALAPCIHRGNCSANIVRSLLLAIDGMSEGELLATVSCIKDLCCVFSKQAKSVYRAVDWQQSVVVCCSACGEGSTKAPLVEKESGLLSECLVKLCSSTHVTVRDGVVFYLPRILNHLLVDSQLVAKLLDFLVDPEASIRYRFSSSLQALVAAGGSSLQDQVIRRLRRALDEAWQASNTQLQDSLLITVSQLGRHPPNNELREFAVLCLLEHSLCCSPNVAEAATQELDELTRALSSTTSDFFKQFRPLVGKFLFESMIKSCSERRFSLGKFLSPLVGAFGFADVRALLISVLRFLLPPLVLQSDTSSSRLLRALARELKTNRRDLLMTHFRHVFAYLVCNAAGSQLATALSFVEAETGLGIGNVLRFDFQRILNELLFHLGSHYDQVSDGLLVLAKEDGFRPVMTTSDLTDFLQPRLLGFLTFFDLQLLNRNVTDVKKKQALSSLERIIKLMGQRHVTALRMKLMATLKLALRLHHGEFPAINCSIWNTFVHNLEPASLGPMLSQVTAILLPLLKLDPGGAKDIFDFLFVENREHFEEYFPDLHFISELPELEHVKDAVAPSERSGQAGLSAILGSCLHGIAHENLDVRLLALGKLKKVLSANQNELAEHLLTRESLEPLVSRLVVQLLSGCREADSKVHILLAECFGELGAIDPGRLELKALSTGEAVVVHTGIDDENFAYDLLQRLCRSYLAAEDSRVQDCSSYAIQEVLKIYNCSDSQSKSGQSLWKRFSSDVQELFTPMLSSRYKANSVSEKYPHPLFGSAYGPNFRDWLANWTLDLLDKVKEKTAVDVFRACSLVLKNDSSLALFLLPRVLVCALADSDQASREEVMLEVLTVLRHCEQTDASGLHHLSAQTVFSVLDYLAVRAKKFRSTTSAGPSSANSETLVLGEEEAVFTRSIPQDLLARVSFNCQAYTRSLLHLETYLHQHPASLQEHLRFLQKIYVALDEPDGIAGVAAVRNGRASLEDQIVEHQAMGKLQDALACYERALRLELPQASRHQGLLSCLLGLDQPSTALTHASGLLAQRSDWLRDINEYRVEAAWRLSSWDALDEFLQAQENVPQDSGNNWSSWGVATGRILLAAHNLHEQSFVESLAQARSHQTSPLAAAAMEQEAYQRGYHYVLRLHILTEVEKGFGVLLNLDASSDKEEKQAAVTALLDVWKSRKSLVQCSPLFMEPLLNVRRALLTIARDKHHDLEDLLQTELAKCWLQSAKLARKTGHLQQAYSCLLETEICDLPDVFLEKAKWLWAKGEREHALNELQRGIGRHFSNLTPTCSGDLTTSPEDRYVCAKAKLLLARYSEESAAVESTKLAILYKSAAQTCSSWEDGLFHLAKYCDTVLNLHEKQEKRAEVMVHVVRHYGESLRYGCQHVYHSMPRLLSIWFDLGSQVAEMGRARRPSAAREKLEQYLAHMTDKVVAVFADQLPCYLFFTAFPQLISRICHSHEQVARQLKAIVARLLRTYPQQAVWMMIAVSKSSYPMRVQRCQEVFQLARQEMPSLGKFLGDTLALCDKLLELCNRPAGEAHVLSITQQLKSLHRLLEDRNFSQILLPLQSAISVTLPSGGASRGHDPFPQTPVHIVGINDKVEILSSLQKPKKITIKGSDGNSYAMMLKPKDDLRKDCRLMEFNNLMNRYLRRNAEGRRRRLHIRTYNVVPLNEECGLIEWIPDLQGFRYILNRIYREKGQLTTGREIKDMMPKLSASLAEKLDVFKNKLLPKFPPVFVEWFHKNFPDPTAWYTARLSYARTLAVMSIVGFILGLGDRHGENILFDANCGDAVHVDFNCLFNKGETFDWPERVPFRLTHNMIDAMGPLGYEGIFRKACEVTLRIMRNETDALMSVLKPFVHDPLVEWSKAPKGSRANPPDSGEIINEKALANVNGIEQRLKGAYRGRNKAAGPPLSVEGQVDYLIQEATSEVNLCQMYVGWGAYL